MASYDSSVVFGKTSGHPGNLTDSAPLRVLEGPCTISAVGGELLYSPADNATIAANWTELAKGTSVGVGAGARMAVMRSDPTMGPCPVGVQWS